MSEFIKYMHVEKFGTAEVEGIEIGTCYVFPKLDGTNASLWVDENGGLRAGSRNREISMEADNHGFHAHIREDWRYLKFFAKHPEVVLYGEWLVPHTLKTYRDDAWRKFYVFDVYNKNTGNWIPFDVYVSTLEEFEIDYLAPIQTIKNGSHDMFGKSVELNKVLLKDGYGVGEGVVIKNYGFVNKYGRTVWAKVVTNEFKERHVKEMGATGIVGDIVEARIAEKFVTQHLVDKTYAKIINETGDGWHSKLIPRLLHTVYYDVITEEMWEILKSFKNPTINFKLLSSYVTARIKELRKDIF
jgi:hypothetical protein